MLTGQRCSQPTCQRGAQSAGQVNGRVRISEIRKCRQWLPSQPFCHRWGGRVSPLCLWFLINVIPALFPLIHMKLNPLPTEIVTLKSQRGINLKTRWAFIWSNKHPSNQGKALLRHNVCVLGEKKHLHIIFVMRLNYCPNVNRGQVQVTRWWKWIIHDPRTTRHYFLYGPWRQADTIPL